VIPSLDTLVVFSYYHTLGLLAKSYDLYLSIFLVIHGLATLIVFSYHHTLGLLAKTYGLYRVLGIG